MMISQLRSYIPGTHIPEVLRGLVLPPPRKQIHEIWVAANVAPDGFSSLKKTLDSLMTQTRRADRILVSLYVYKPEYNVNDINDINDMIVDIITDTFNKMIRKRNKEYRITLSPTILTSMEHYHAVFRAREHNNDENTFVSFCKPGDLYDEQRLEMFEKNISKNIRDINTHLFRCRQAGMKHMSIGSFCSHLGLVEKYFNQTLPIVIYKGERSREELFIYSHNHHVVV